MKVLLEVTDGERKGTAFDFEDPGGFTFGRASDCTCVVTGDNTFSRHHFYLEINPPNVLLKDLGSLNGTYVNGEKFGGRDKTIAPEDAKESPPIALRDGDVLKAGANQLTVKIEAFIYCVDCGKEILSDQRKAGRVCWWLLFVS